MKLRTKVAIVLNGVDTQHLAILLTKVKNNGKQGMSPSDADRHFIEEFLSRANQAERVLSAAHGEG